MATSTDNLIAAKCICGEIMIPKRKRCIACLKATTHVELKNIGTIITFTILNVPPDGFTAPLILGLIELEPPTSEKDLKKPRILCEGKVPENNLKIGLKVKISHTNGKYLFSNLKND